MNLITINNIRTYINLFRLINYTLHFVNEETFNIILNSYETIFENWTTVAKYNFKDTGDFLTYVRNRVEFNDHKYPERLHESDNEIWPKYQCQKKIGPFTDLVTGRFQFSSNCRLGSKMRHASCRRRRRDDMRLWLSADVRELSRGEAWIGADWACDKHPAAFRVPRPRMRLHSSWCMASAAEASSNPVSFITFFNFERKCRVGIETETNGLHHSKKKKKKQEVVEKKSALKFSHSIQIIDVPLTECDRCLQEFIADI